MASLQSVACDCCWKLPCDMQAHTLEERFKQLQLDQQPPQQQQPQQPQQQSVHGNSSSGASDARQSSACMSAGARSGSGPGTSLAPWPAACRNPYAECEPPMPAQVNSYTCQKSFKVREGHRAASMLADSNGTRGTACKFEWHSVLGTSPYILAAEQPCWSGS